MRAAARVCTWWLVGSLLAYGFGVFAPLFLPWRPFMLVGEWYWMDKRWRSMFATKYLAAEDSAEVLAHAQSPDRVLARLALQDYSCNSDTDLMPFGGDSGAIDWDFVAVEGGWPFRCTWGWRRTAQGSFPAPSTPPKPSRGGFWETRFPWDPPPNMWDPLTAARMTGFLPRWPQLLADGAVFGVAARVLLAAPALTRRAIRRRRNLCTHCAYARAGLPPAAPCPECGR